MSGDIKTKLDCAATEEVERPLVHYRKKDDQRVQQINELHDAVADKVDDVMASFKETPSKTQLYEEEILRKIKSRSRKIPVEKTGIPRFFWVLCVLFFLSLILMVLGWKH